MTSPFKLRVGAYYANFQSVIHHIVHTFSYPKNGSKSNIYVSDLGALFSEDGRSLSPLLSADLQNTSVICQTYAPLKPYSGRRYINRVGAIVKITHSTGHGSEVVFKDTNDIPYNFMGLLLNQEDLDKPNVADLLFPHHTAQNEYLPYMFSDPRNSVLTLETNKEKSDTVAISMSDLQKITELYNQIEDIAKTIGLKVDMKLYGGETYSNVL